MSKEDKNKTKKLSKTIMDNLDVIRNVTKSSKSDVYGIERDPVNVIVEGNKYLDKQLITANVGRDRINSTERKNKGADPYDLVKEVLQNKSVVGNISNILGDSNVSYKQMLQDIEISKRSVPQVFKVLNTLISNIKSPDSINVSPFNIKYGSAVDQSDKRDIDKLVEKYELNKKLTSIVNEYLLIGVKYNSVVPYERIADMLSAGDTLQESIQLLNESVKGDISTLYDAGGKNTYTINESCTMANKYEDLSSFIVDNEVPNDQVNRDFSGHINELLKGIEFVRGSVAYHKDTIINEAVTKVDDGINVDSLINMVKRQGNKKKDKSELTSDGLLSPTEVQHIKNSVQFRGSHIEELDASRMLAFKIRGNTIGYFYVEDKVKKKNNSKNGDVMSHINDTIYGRVNKKSKTNAVESATINIIGKKMISSINPKFLTDNMDQMDLIYQFVKENEIHKKQQRVIFFPKEDICEFKREEGSIMKNAMFMLKLYILTILTNTIANVTRGTDRNMWYVQTGLTTDLEKKVNNAINSIQRNQVRYSDISTLNEVFNIVGSAVDVFMPTSVDNTKPIETEVISGQNIDMNNDFLDFLIKSVILSFGVPSVTIDQMDEPELAKTLSMSNIDIARSVLDAQLELNPVLTKMFRQIVQYELPDFQNLDAISVQLTPPSAIIMEMTNERIRPTTELNETLAELLFPQQIPEDQAEKRKRLFKLEMFKVQMNSLDWTLIEDIVNKIDMDGAKETDKEKIKQGDDQGNMY